MNESQETLFHMVHGREPTPVEREVISGFPEIRGAASRDLDAWLPVTLFLAIWQVFADGSGPHTVVIFYPGSSEKKVQAGIKTFLRDLQARDPNTAANLKKVLDHVGLSYRPPRGDDGRPWTAVGYLATDPIPRWLLTGLRSAE